MTGHNGSWWGWLLAAFVLLAVFGDGDLPVFPLVIGFLILSGVLGKRRRVSHGRRPDGRTGTDRPAPLVDGPQDSPMPTIDVPRFPGEAAPPGQPYRYGAPSVTPPPPGPASGPPPHPGLFPAPGGPAPQAGAPHTSTDPVVSLGQLHLARCGRDLRAAAQHGSTADVARVLDEIRDLSRRMQDMLEAAEGSPGSGRREFRTGLRAIDELVEDARGEHPPGARLTRVTQACLRMGQTGRHE